MNGTAGFPLQKKKFPQKYFFIQKNDLGHFELDSSVEVLLFARVLLRLLLRRFLLREDTIYVRTQLLENTFCLRVSSCAFFCVLPRSAALSSTAKEHKL